MSELVVFVLRILFLALLWLFILFIANVIRTDMWGRAIPADPAGAARETQPPAPAQAAAPPRHAPPPEPERQSARQRPKYVTVENGPLAGRTFSTSAELGIGRSVDNEIILTDDFASSHHARIVAATNGVFLHDLGSTNGTFVNDVRVVDPQQLQLGDTIRIGRTTMALGR